MVFLLCAALAALVSRVVYLSVIDQHFLRNQGDARTLRVIDLPAYRGMITDRNNSPLAVSSPVKSVWVDPHKLELDEEDIRLLAHLLNTKTSELKQLLNKNKKREFLYLKRRIDPQLAAQIEDLHIPGVYLQEEFRRFYPEGEVTAHVLGFTNIDDKGDEGLELGYDAWLHGIVGKKRVLKDRYGNTVAEVQNLRDPRPGKNLVLSIDRRIQYLSYKSLEAAMEEYGAESGSVVVLDVKSGEVLAMVNMPTFNPNENAAAPSENKRNRAVTDVFEPGSAMKAFSIASAIGSGKYTPDSKVDTGRGSFNLGRNTVRDIHAIGVATVRVILQKSSNVGTAKLVLSLPPSNLWKMLKAVGFGTSTYSGFPGERSGSLNKRRISSPFLLATLSFGYGVSVSALQLTQAYAILANHGVRVPITFLKRTQPIAGQQVVDRKVADTMINMLTSVVEEVGGTGHGLVKVPGYRVGGKTGTARLVGPHGYDAHKHLAIFSGMGPVPDSRLVVVVVIKNPSKKGYYGGVVAGPVFAKVMEGALRILEVPPNAITSVSPEQNEVKSAEDDD